MRSIKYIVIHCTATKAGAHVDLNMVDRWHRNRGWSGIGYHYLIELSGKISVGRPEIKQGAHVKGFNKQSIGVVYVGGLDKNNAPKDTRTPGQKSALIYLLRQLKCKYPNAKILGHRDFSPDKNKNGIIEPFEWLKHCPCFDVKNEYKNL